MAAGPGRLFDEKGADLGGELRELRLVEAAEVGWRVDRLEECHGVLNAPSGKCVAVQGSTRPQYGRWAPRPGAPPPAPGRARPEDQCLACEPGRRYASGSPGCPRRRLYSRSTRSRRASTQPGGRPRAAIRG